MKPTAIKYRVYSLKPIRVLCSAVLIRSVSDIINFKLQTIYYFMYCTI